VNLRTLAALALLAVCGPLAADEWTDADYEAESAYWRKQGESLDRRGVHLEWRKDGQTGLIEVPNKVARPTVVEPSRPVKSRPRIKRIIIIEIDDTP